MLERFLRALDPLYGADVAAKKFFFTKGASQVLLVALVREEEDSKFVFALPETENSVRTKIALTPEAVDGLIEFLTDCRKAVG